MKKKDMVVVALCTFCLTATLFMMIPTRSETPVGTYDPWVDINDDGAVNILDSIIIGNHFLTSGTETNKTSVLYDSGWVNITDKAGQNIVFSHGLGMLDWNDESIIAEITGKTVPDGELLRHLGLQQLQTWNMSYGRIYPWSATYALVQTADGGYALASTKNSSGADGLDAWLVKTDASGNCAWNVTHGGTGADTVHALVQTADGGYALAGDTNSYGAGSRDAWLVRTDSSGNHVWNKTYGGASSDSAWALVQTADGGYALAGYTDSSGAGSSDFWLVKTDAEGNSVWNMTYGGADGEGAYALVQTADGGYALAGITRSFGAFYGDMWLVRTDFDGNEQWNKTYGGTWQEEAHSLVQTADGGYILAGGTDSFGAGDVDAWLVKTDANGIMQWNKTYGETGGEMAVALVRTIDGGYALAGWTFSYGPSYDFWLVKTDAFGNLVWNKTYGGASTNEAAYALMQTADAGYALAGWTYSYGTGDYDLWLVKTDVDGGFSTGETGLAWVVSAAGTATLYRGAQDTIWNYVRVRILKAKK